LKVLSALSINALIFSIKPLSPPFEYDNGEATRNPKIRLLREDKKQLTHHIPAQFGK
jgi:hypothetical protein